MAGSWERRLWHSLGTWGVSLGKYNSIHIISPLKWVTSFKYVYVSTLLHLTYAPYMYFYSFIHVVWWSAACISSLSTLVHIIAFKAPCKLLVLQINCCHVSSLGDRCRRSDGQAVGCKVWRAVRQLQGSPLQPQVCRIRTTRERYTTYWTNTILQRDV